MSRTATIFFFILASVCAPLVSAQEVHQELQGVLRAEVVKIVAEETREITGTDATALVQTVTARLRSGERAGELVTFDNDLVALAAGDGIFINHLITIDGNEYFTFKDVDRRGMLAFLAALLALLMMLFAGWQGTRAIASLIGSALLILFVLAPALLAGYPPVPTSVAVAGATLAVMLFVTHGVTARTTIAFLGTFGAVAATGVFSAMVVYASRLTGFGSDASVYLNFSTNGALDFSGLLLAGIIIGMLGVLDDVAITQASVVGELKAANPSFTVRELYRRALRVGRDHVASLVNTLALAYVGASLPLILLLARADAPFGLLVNQEIVAAEIVRIIIGSIGLILAVPLTTAVAAWWYAKHGSSGGGRAHSHG